MPTQTDPDAPELLRQVEALVLKTQTGDQFDQLEAEHRLEELAEAALLPLLTAVVALRESVVLHMPSLPPVTAKAVEGADTALRAVAEALGKEAKDE